MSLVRPGRSSIFVILRFRLKNFGRIGRVCTTFGMPRRSIFFAKFQHDPVKHVKILANRRLRRETKRILNTDRPYSSPAGLREPKPEPVDEEPLAPHEFMYRLCIDAKASSPRALVDVCCPRFQGATLKSFFGGRPKR